MRERTPIAHQVTWWKSLIFPNYTTWRKTRIFTKWVIKHVSQKMFFRLSSLVLLKKSVTVAVSFKLSLSLCLSVYVCICLCVHMCLSLTMWVVHPCSILPTVLTWMCECVCLCVCVCVWVVYPSNCINVRDKHLIPLGVTQLLSSYRQRGRLKIS